jgi:hypothetical protein
MAMNTSNRTLVTGNIQNIPGAEVNILGGHSIILSKNVYMYMPYSERLLRYNYLIVPYRRATRHVLTQLSKCIDVDGGIR